MARASSRPDPAALAAGEVAAAAAEMGVFLTLHQSDALAGFAGLLQRWTSVHNLTAIRNSNEVLSHHLLDSLAILPAIRNIFPQKAATVLDVGSGGGLPGIPLAIAEPAYDVTLVDKVAKKVAFLTQAKLELTLGNVHCVHSRVESLRVAPFDLVVSRAFAALPEFVALTQHLVAAGGWWAAMKGTLPETELAELARSAPRVQVMDVVKLAVPRLGAERHLILLQRP